MAKLGPAISNQWRAPISPLSIYAFDKSEHSLGKSKELFDQARKLSETRFIAVVNKLSQIEGDVDVAIIASSSRERGALIDALLEVVVPKHIILEKVLFNRVVEYQKYASVFERIRCQVWVKQYMGFEFSFLSSAFAPEESLDMRVSGNWGLCCNSTHFIEIFHHLCGRSPLRFNELFPGSSISSKRDGYFELAGRIEISSPAQQRLTLDCDFQRDEKLINIEITSKHRKLIDIWVDEYHNCTLIDGSSSSKARYYSRRQSERTLDLIVALRDRGECNLPSYEQSAAHHLLVLEHFKDKFSLLGLDVSHGIPIT